MKNRLLKTFTSLVLTVLMVLSIMPAFAITIGAEGGTYKLVTDASTLAVGDKVIIVATGSDVAMSTTQKTNNRGQVSITKNIDNTITIGTDVQVFELEAGAKTGTFAFKTGSGYIYAASSSSNNLKTETTLSDNSSWTITITEAGVATITAQGSNTRNLLKYNSSSSLFSCYASGQQNVSIYKLEENTGGSVTPVCEHENKEEEFTKVDATCTTPGKEAGFKCADCGETIGCEPIPATGHSGGTATCTELKTCDVCGEKYGELAAHNYVDGVCTVCEAVAPLTASFVSSKLGLENSEAFSSITVNDVVSFSAEKGEGKNAPAYYTTGEALRIYGKNTFSISVASGYKIVSVTIKSLKDYPTESNCTVNNGNVTGLGTTEVVITPKDATMAITLTNNADSGHFKITEISVEYCEIVCPHSDIKDVAEVPATCTKSGTTAGVYCNDCKTYISGHEEIKAKGHTWGEIIDGCCECSVCHEKTKTISEVLESADGTAVVVCGTVTLINTPWNDSNNSISVTIADADGKELLLYKMATKVEVGDIIRVSGTKITYNNEIKEINAGATAEIIGHKDVEVVYTEMTIPGVIAADDNTPVTVKGTVKEINIPWNDYNKNISVTIVDADGNELYLYRLATKVELGDEITVKGLVGSYNGSKQIAAGATAEITGKATVLNSVALSLNKGVTVKVKITIPKKWLTAGAKVVFSNVVSLDAKAGENVYSVDLTPAQINDALTVKITSKDGSTIFLDEKDVSVSAYRAKAVAAGASTQLIALLDAALTYSNAADCAIEEELTETFTDVADPQIEHENVNAKLLTAFSGNLGTYASIYINVNTANVKEGDKLVLKIGETGIINDDIAKYITKDGQIVISGLYPANFDDTISIDTTIEGSNATFTFNSYLKAIYKDNSSTKQVKNLAVATYLYGLAAEAYLATLQ